MDGDIGLLNFFADVPEGRGCIITDFIGGQNAGGDSLVKKFQRLQQIKIRVKAVKSHGFLFGIAKFFDLCGDG